MREVTLVYFDDCPNWRLARGRLRQALSRLGVSDTPVKYRRVGSPAEAERIGVHGSPTILVDGCDPFADAIAEAGLVCRIYPTPDGLQASPTVDQLQRALQS